MFGDFNDIRLDRFMTGEIDSGSREMAIKVFAFPLEWNP